MSAREARRKRRRQRPLEPTAETSSPSPRRWLNAYVVLAFGIGAIIGSLFGGIFFYIAVFLTILSASRLIGRRLRQSVYERRTRTARAAAQQAAEEI